MGLTLDDLRQPRIGGRIWGYDRDEVDQLLASVVVSIERLARRRHRDTEAIERVTTEAREATERAERAERDRDELIHRIELADEAVEQVVADANRRAERLVAEAEERAEQAEDALQVLETEWVESAGAGEPGSGPGGEIATSNGPDPRRRLPLALRAARALLADARIRATAIEAEARRRTGGPDPVGDGGDEDDPTSEDHSNRSGSSATIHW